MIFIYCCYGGAHSSPVAAAIHIGKLDLIRIPTAQEIYNIKYYDKVDSTERGKLLYMGDDQSGNKIYVLGRGNEKVGIEQAIKSGFALAGASQGDLVFIDTLSVVNLIMRIGGFLSRKLKLIFIGRPLVIWGTQKAFMQLVKIVEQTKIKYGLTEM